MCVFKKHYDKFWAKGTDKKIMPYSVIVMSSVEKDVVYCLCRKALIIGDIKNLMFSISFPNVFVSS